MKCPFRTDEKGEFEECYGAECMAYYEYDMPSYTPPLNYDTCNMKKETVHITVCKRMSSFPIPYGYYSGCN